MAEPGYEAAWGRFLAAFGRLPAPLALFDVTGRCFAETPALWGVAWASWSGVTLPARLPNVHARILRGAIEDALIRGTTRTVRFPMGTDGAGTRWFEATVGPFPDADMRMAAVAQVTDATASQRARADRGAADPAWRHVHRVAGTETSA